MLDNDLAVAVRAREKAERERDDAKRDADRIRVSQLSIDGVMVWMVR